MESNFDFVLENIMLEKLKVDKLATEVDNLSFIYCLESGREYDQSAYDDARVMLSSHRDILIQWLLFLFKKYCSNENIDLNELELYCKEKIKND